MKRSRGRAAVAPLWVLVVVSLLTAVLAAGCSSDSGDGGEAVVLSGSGQAVTKEFDLGGFTSVTFDSAVTAAVIYDAEVTTVAVTIDDNLVEHVVAEVEGDTLHIGMDPANRYSGHTLRATVVIPSLSGLEASGKARVRAYGFASSQPLSVAVSGGSRIGFSGMGAGEVTVDASGDSGLSGDLSAQTLIAVVSGAGRIGVTGTVRTARLEASGASNLDLGTLIIRDLDVTLSGGSRGTVVVTDSLNADVSGGSHLEYSGTPVLGEVSSSGGGRIEHAGE